MQFHRMTCLLSDGANRSVDVLDTEVDKGKYTLSGLSADTNYTLSVAAVSVAGQSESIVIMNVTTATSTTWHIIVVMVIATVTPVLIILVPIGVYTCVRCV